MPRILSSQEKTTLDAWLHENKIVINARTRRDLSDVVPTAHLVKKYHSKIVEMHNYPPSNSIALKLINWETFNNKVLIKLGIPQTRTALHNLANGTPGAIESLLFEFMNCERLRGINIRPTLLQKRKSHDTGGRNISLRIPIQHLQCDQQSHYLDTIEDEKIAKRYVLKAKDIITVDMKTVKNGRVMKVPKKMVDYDIYESVVRETKEKDDFINSITQKSHYLESIIRVKEDRINELVDQLGKLSVSILSKMYNLDSKDATT